jgi:hypothetical protein
VRCELASKPKDIYRRRHQHRCDYNYQRCDLAGDDEYSTNSARGIKFLSARTSEQRRHDRRIG